MYNRLKKLTKKTRYNMALVTHASETQNQHSWCKSWGEKKRIVFKTQTGAKLLRENFDDSTFVSDTKRRRNFWTHSGCALLLRTLQSVFFLCYVSRCFFFSLFCQKFTLIERSAFHTAAFLPHFEQGHEIARGALLSCVIKLD